MMGRTKAEGSKQIARQLDNPRVELIGFYSAKTKMKLWVSSKLAAGLKERGVLVAVESDQ